MSGWGNGEGQVGRENAKNFALEKAGNAGATHIVWYPFEDRFIPRVKGSAYRCSVITEEFKEEKDSQRQTPPETTSEPKESPKRVRSIEDKDPIPKLGTGTGWVSSSGYIVTNHHVIEGASEILLYLRSGSIVTLTLLLADKANDLALLKADDYSLLPVGLEIASEPAGMGASVFTIGYPHPDLLGLEPKLVNGTISSTTGMRGDPRYIQITVPVQSGNSGGPLLNKHGQVVGVITSKLSALYVLQETGDLTQNINFAIKADYANLLMKTVEDNVPKLKSISPLSYDLEEISSSARNAIGMIVVTK